MTRWANSSTLCVHRGNANDLIGAFWVAFAHVPGSQQSSCTVDSSCQLFVKYSQLFIKLHLLQKAHQVQVSIRSWSGSISSVAMRCTLAVYFMFIDRLCVLPCVFLPCSVHVLISLITKKRALSWFPRFNNCHSYSWVFVS
jgi:hypothetical protein